MSYAILDSTFLKNFWEIANNRITKAEKITLIGYSLPIEDDMVIRMLKNSKKKAKFIVVNRTTSGISKTISDLNRTVHKEFGSVNAVSDYVKSL